MQAVNGAVLLLVATWVAIVTVVAIHRSPKAGE